MSLTMTKLEIEILADPEALASRVADWMLDVALATTGAFAVALSGGSTPQRLYRHLASSRYRETFPWSRTHVFWGDERFVPHDDVLSNFRMVQEALLAHVPIPAVNIHAVATQGLTPEDSAARYERELKAFYGAERLDPARPLFDLMLLGLGLDGHTASLFPNTAVLSEHDRWAAAVLGVKAEPRITLTYPALESSRHTAFLVAGEEKRIILNRLRQGDDSLPAARLHPRGSLCAFIDAAATTDPSR